MKNYDIVIIGGGPAGLTAAMYAARANKTVVVYEKLAAGGQLAVTPVIENYPGAVSADGWEIAEKMKAQALKEGAEIVFADVERVDLEKKELKVGSEHVSAKAIIIATGAHSGKLGLPREEELRGAGVSYCAVCDGAFFRGKDVALAGGGERSMADLKYLAGVCRKVYYVAENVVSERLPYENVVVLSLSKVSELKGSPLNGITVTRDGKNTELEVSGLFVDTALKPESALFAGKLETDIGGFIVTDGEMRTSTEKVYAAGDVRSKTLRQVVTAAGDGATAAATALKELKKK